MKRPIVMIEGLDRVGKGSHITELTRLLPGLPKVIHCEGPDTKIATSILERVYYQMFTFYNQIKEIASSEERPIIFDRSFLGETVWSKYYDRHIHQFGSEYQLGVVVERIWTSPAFQSIKDQILVVFLDGQADIIADRIRKSPEDNRIYTSFCKYNVEDNVHFLKTHFQELEEILVQRGIPVLHLMSNVPEDIESNANIILSQMNG